MIVENPEALKSWLAVLLSKKCDADPEALAKYILALVKKDKSTQALKTFLLDQLEIFLSKETKTFVDVLFDVLESKTYLTPIINAENPLDKTSLTAKSSSTVTDSPKEENAANAAAKNKPSNDNVDKSYKSRENTGSRKRSIDDENLSSKKARESFKSHNEEHYFPKSIKKEKNQDGKNDGNYKFHRSRSRSPDKDNSRSRSRSKSKEREKRTYADSSPRDKSEARTSKIEHSKKISHSYRSHEETDYRNRQNSDVNSKLMQRENMAYAPKQRKRCQDYDEKGYCLKGDLCDFDHGTDPILVENVSALNFGVPLPPDQFEGVLNPPLPSTPPTMPPLPPTIPPPPLPNVPPPPLPPPGYFPEPYNPEVPGMNPVSLPLPNTHFYLPPSHLPPPPLPPGPPLGPPPSFHNKSKQRTRELIGVTTVDSFDAPRTYPPLDRRSKTSPNDRSYLKPLNSTYSATRTETTSRGDFKPKGFDYSRLGPLPVRKSLELRKIPKSLNSITNLHSHFSKFGNVVNIEIGCNNDPEAAKVSFATHAEATKAYRSTEPILNNRFIKVFWNNGFKKGMDNTFSRDVSEAETRTSPENNYETPFEPKETNEEESHVLDTNIEISLPSKGNLPRTVIVSPPQTTKSPMVFSSATRKVTEKEVNTPTHQKKKFALFQAKSKHVDVLIQYQKDILDQLLKAKTQEDRNYLKKTLGTISEKIKALQNDLKKDGAEFQNVLKSAPQVRRNLKTLTKKELLDAELDLYNKEHNGDEDTSELELKVNEMKRKAKALGLIERTPHSSKFASRRRGNSRYHPSSSVSSLSIDRRPRKLLVVGSSDKEGLQRHFKQFGNIEKLEEVSSGFLITFCSRTEAEAAYIYGAKFEDVILNISWFNERQMSATQIPDFGSEDSEQKTMDEEANEADEEEEDEEDSEARSWRR